MRHWENIWSFETARVRVAFDVAPENDLDLSWDEDGSTAAGLESGEYVAFQARMTVYIDGAEAGADYLGNCIYRSAEEFIDHRGCKAGGYGSYFSDMVRGAIAEARQFASRPALPLRITA